MKYLIKSIDRVNKNENTGTSRYIMPFIDLNYYSTCKLIYMSPLPVVYNITNQNNSFYLIENNTNINIVLTNNYYSNNTQLASELAIKLNSSSINGYSYIINYDAYLNIYSISCNNIFGIKWKDNNLYKIFGYYDSHNNPINFTNVQIANSVSFPDIIINQVFLKLNICEPEIISTNGFYTNFIINCNINKNDIINNYNYQYNICNINKNYNSYNYLEIILTDKNDNILYLFNCEYELILLFE